MSNVFKSFFQLSLLFLFLPGSSMLYAGELQLEQEYKQFEGDPVDLQAQIGKRPLYLKFWASWCLDCRRQMPDLQRTYQEYKDAIGIYAVNLNINETPKTLGQIKNKYDLTVPIVLDNNGSIAANFNFVGTPFHVLINRQGKVVYATYKADETLHKKLDQLAHKNLMSSVDDGVVSDAEKVKVDIPQGLTVRYFSASWCDSYFLDVEPEMAQNCVRANNVVSHLYDLAEKSTNAVDWQAYATYLWATAEDVDEYQKSHNIQYPLIRDKANRVAHAYHVDQYPTLLIFRNGKEVRRITRFDNEQKLQKKLQSDLGL